MSRRLSRRLERHFDEIRDLETRIASMPVTGGACQRPGEPPADPAVGGNNAGSGSDSIGTNTGYSDEHQLTVFQSHMNVYPITDMLGTPVRADLHECGHNGDSQNRGQMPAYGPFGHFALERARRCPHRFTEPE